MKWYQQGHEARAFETFEALAHRGDRRAQYMAGLMLIEGNGVAVDRVRGYSWLQISAQGYYGAFGRSTENLAAQSVLSHGDTLTGSELIRAEQATQAFLQEKAAAAEALKVKGRRQLMGEPSEDAGKVVTGCAVDRTLNDCPSNPPPRPSCTGNLPEPDINPTGNDESARITRPEYPLAARQLGWEGTMVGLAHVDWTGYVCRVAMLIGTGFPEVDDATLESVRRWRLKPAMAGGVPVEGLYDVAVTLEEYKLDLE
jgi:TonB family protein